MKKNKKVIGIDINEILRAFWMQFDKFYISEFGLENAPDVDEPIEDSYDFFKNYKWDDIEEEIKILNEDIPEDISPLDYQVDENGNSKVDFIAFKTEKEKLTAKEVYNRFLYQDYLFEIFGSAPKIYKQVDNDIDKFFNKYKDQFEIVIVSKENWFSISPTLFFLSKLRPRIKSYFFGENNKEILNKVDFLITTDPELLKESTKKTIIKIDRPFNQKIEKDFSKNNLIDLVDDEEFENLINYKK